MDAPPPGRRVFPDTNVLGRRASRRQAGAERARSGLGPRGYPQDLPGEPRSPLGIQVQGPDEYLAELADEFPEDCMRVVQQMVERRQRRDPNVTLELLLDRWSSGLGLAHFCARLGPSS